MTAQEASKWILDRTPRSFRVNLFFFLKMVNRALTDEQKMLETNYSYGFERDEDQLKRNDGDFRKWSNPLEVRLGYFKLWN